MIPVEDIVAAAVEGVETVVHDLRAAKASYPDDHQAGMKVPKGGSSCAVCEYLKGPHECGNKYFIQWNGSNHFEPASDEYCCDWFESGKKLEAAGTSEGAEKAWDTRGRGRHTKEEIKNIAYDAQAAMSDYKQNSANWVNNWLRDGKPMSTPQTRAEYDIANIVRKLDKAFDTDGVHSVTAKPITVYRGIEKESLFDKFSKGSWTGKLITDKAFLSTSRSDEIAEAAIRENSYEPKGVMLHIRLPKGTSYLPGRADEEEMVLNRGLKLKILDVEKGDEIVHVTVTPVTKSLEAASEVSLEGQQKGTLWNGIHIQGFTGPQEEGLRAMLSRIPPELLFNVKCIKSAKELNAKHGRYNDETHTIEFNPANFQLRQRFGKGDNWILHPELTTVHEVGHSIYRSLTPEQTKEWEDISGWMQGWKPGQSIAYQEKRPGWGNAISEWTHKAGIKFTRHYGERNPDEDFSDCFAFVILGKGHQMEPAKKAFIDKYIKDNVHAYPQVSIQSPVKASSNLYNIYSGGPGSGRHKGPEKEKPLSTRAQRALSTYVAQTKGKSQIARLNEVLVAKYVKGETTGDNKPFDVLTKKVGIGVKTMFPGIKNEKITMHTESLARKVKAQKELKVKVWTVALDMRNDKLDTYIKPALGSFRLGSMQKIDSIKDLGRYIK